MILFLLRYRDRSFHTVPYPPWIPVFLIDFHRFFTGSYSLVQLFILPKRLATTSQKLRKKYTKHSNKTNNKQTFSVSGPSLGYSRDPLANTMNRSNNKDSFELSKTFYWTLSNGRSIVLFIKNGYLLMFFLYWFCMFYS